MAVCLWEISLRNLQKKLHNNASTLNCSVSFQQNQPIPKPRNLANIKRLCEGDMQKPHTNFFVASLQCWVLVASKTRALTSPALCHLSTQSAFHSDTCNKSDLGIPMLVASLSTNTPHTQNIALTCIHQLAQQSFQQKGRRLCVSISILMRLQRNLYNNTDSNTTMSVDHDFMRVTDKVSDHDLHHEVHELQCGAALTTQRVHQ
jgi:hypothetical protein